MQRRVYDELYDFTLPNQGVDTGYNSVGVICWSIVVAK